jgi:hypothetical protein
MASPLFSILMPTHHRPDVIGHAITSVLGQQCGDFELLVVGDGAGPDTAAVVASFGDSRVRWFDFPKAPGFGYANRNHALRQSQGQYIAFASDDDLWLPHHLATLKDLLAGGAALAATRALWVSADGIAAPFFTNLSITDELEGFMKRHNSIPAGCFAYRADALPERAVWPEAVPHSGDWDLWRRIIAAHPGNPLAVSPTFSLMHFTARRKNARDSQMVELRRLLEFADHTDWWPAALKPPIPEGRTEQSVWTERIAEQGEAFIAEIARAVGEVAERLAWEYVQSTLRPAQRKLDVLAPRASLPPDFDPAAYLAIHPDAAGSGLDPATHWLQAGYFEGRRY